MTYDYYCNLSPYQNIFYTGFYNHIMNFTSNLFVLQNLVFWFGKLKYLKDISVITLKYNYTNFRHIVKKILRKAPIANVGSRC